MTPEEIRQKVIESFNGGGIDITDAVALTQRAKFLVDMGIEHDADAICHIHDCEGSISVIIVVGKSVLMGMDAYKWVDDYHNNIPSATKQCIEKIADFAAQVLPTDEDGIMPFVDSKNKAWRSFRLSPAGKLKNVDEVRKRAFQMLGRKPMEH
jgi:hypothetical protein